MGRLVCVRILHSSSMISRRFTSSSLLRHRTLISIVKRLSFLKIWSSRLLLLRLLLLFVLNINIIIISVSSVHLVRHVKTTEIWRNKLPTCDLRTSLLIRHYSCMNLTPCWILTCFHLCKTFSFFFNSRSSIIDLLLLFLIHRIWWLILVLLLLHLLNFSILWLAFLNFRRSFPCLCTSSLSRMTPSWLWTSSVSLQMLLNKLFNFRLSHAVKILIS